MRILRAFGQTLIMLGIIWLVYATGMLAMNSWWLLVWILGWGTLFVWFVNKAIDC